MYTSFKLYVNISKKYNNNNNNNNNYYYYYCCCCTVKFLVRNYFKVLWRWQW